MPQPPLEDQDVEVIDRPSPERDLSFMPWPRKVRAVFAGQTVAESDGVHLLREQKRLPVYYFPRQDVREEFLVKSETRSRTPSKGDATHWHVTVGDRVSEDAAWAFLDPPPAAAGLSGFVAFHWDRLDAWFEEDDEVFVHPRDPYHRVDVLNSSRYIRVEVDGETIAETTRPRLLFETGLPTRYYFPKLDVRLELLEPSDRTTSCPYKGRASYWNVRVGDRLHADMVWSYRAPIPECPKIENLLAFFNERVDVYVDGVLQERPVTPWSKPDWGRSDDRAAG